MAPNIYQKGTDSVYDQGAKTIYANGPKAGQEYVAAAPVIAPAVAPAAVATAAAPKLVADEATARSLMSGSGASDEQIQQIVTAMNAGQTNHLGVPNNIGTILGTKTSLPDPSKPINVSDLGSASNSSDINQMLSAAMNNPNPSSSIAGLLSLYGASSKQQEEYDKSNQDLLALTKSLGGESSDLTTELGNQGVPAAYQQVKELNLKAAQMKGELDVFDVQTEKDKLALEDQPVTDRVVSNQQAKYLRDRNLDKMAKAAELSATVALSQAYQGNAELGAQLAQQSVTLKYAPIKNAIDVLQKQLSIQKDSLSGSAAKNNKIIDTLISLKKDSIDRQASNDTKIQTLAIQAASNGAPLSIVRAIQSSTDPVAAAAAGSTWLKGNLESVNGSGGGSTNTFTQTQKNGGASNAGLSVESFGSLEPDVQNYFVNNKGASLVMSDINDVANGDANAKDILADIESSGLPPAVVTYLKGRLSAATPAPGAGGNVFKGAWQGIRSVLGF